MHQLISSGTFDSPSWDLVRTSKLAARIYAPLGTQMSLGDHVRLSCTFLEAFKGSPTDEGTAEKTSSDEIHANEAERETLRKDLKVSARFVSLSLAYNLKPGIPG
jgi:glycerol-3-phosphate O-acyltransferase/dihydroxyacetone phosphate acyltransferase